MFKNILLIFSLIFFFLINNTLAQDFWEPTGEIQGGRVVKIAVAPNGYIYAGGAYGGIFRSTDDGITWKQTNNGLKDLGLRIQVIKCDKDNRVFAGTANGIYLSTDNGDNWDNVYSGHECYDLTISSSGHIFAAAYNYQILRSTNNGNNWTRLQNGIDTTDLSLVEYTTNGILIAVDWYKGIFKSTDEGETWSASSNGYTISDGPSSVSSDDRGNIFISTYYGGIYESTNDGDNWSNINGDIADTYLLDAAEDSSGNIYTATFTDLYKSTNSGTNWTQLNTGTPSKALQCVTIDDSDNIVVGTNYDGVVRSTDRGTNWEKSNNGLYLTTIMNLVKDSSDNLYAVVKGRGIFKSTDDGTSWDLVNIKDDFYNLSILDLTALPSGGLMAAATFGGTYITNDYTTWNPFTHPFTGNYAFITIAASVNGYLFGGMANGEIYRSPIAGDNWTDIRDTIHTGRINKIDVSPSGEVYVLSDSGVYHSSDNGDSWVKVNDTLASYNYAVAFAPWGDIYIGGVGTNAGVYRSTDDGVTWNYSNYQDGLTNAYIISLAIDKNTIYAGSYNGVFSSSDSGKTWQPLTTGLTSGWIYSLMVTSSDHLLAGTRGAGIFRSRNILTGITKKPKNSIPHSFILHQNYPNPFNPSTVISWQLPVGGHVKLNVYDVLGRKIATLVNAEKPAGSYKIKFNAAGLASGIYFYRLESNGNIKTKKMILLR